MALPGDELSSMPAPSAFIGGTALSVSRTQDHETGAGALNDPTLGHFYQMWHARIVNDRILVSSDNTPEFLFYEGSAVNDVSIAFDQNMRLHVAYTDMGVAYLHWYDAQTASEQTMNLGASVRTPKITLDDKREENAGASDVLLFYIREGRLYQRRQRDRFAVEKLLNVGPFLGLSKSGMNTGLRVQFLLAPEDVDE